MTTRILLAMLCCLLALTNSASADCAWVVWGHGNDASRWWFYEATPDYHTCVARQKYYRDETLKGLSRTAEITYGPGWSVSGLADDTHGSQSGQRISQTTMCLPETMDPAKVTR